MSTPRATAQATPLKWFYLSFADKTFLGSVVIEAVDTTDASRRAWAAGINPGGQMLAVEIDDLALFPPQFRNRLLSRDEVVNVLDGVRIGDMSQETRKEIGLTDLHCVGCVCSKCAAKEPA